MLVLSRKTFEQIVIEAEGVQIIVVPVRCSDGRVRLGITAPENFSIKRIELISAEGSATPLAATVGTAAAQSEGGSL